MKMRNAALSVDGWVSRAAVIGPAEPEPMTEAVVPLGATAPQPGIRQPERLLPLREAAPGWWVLGVHGGAGETTIAAHLELWEAGHAWPVSPFAPVQVILVARLDGRGVYAAQQAVQQWASGAVPGVEVAGIVWSADAPGKPLKAIRDAAKVVSGGVPVSWSLPWVELWRPGQLVADERLPGGARKTLLALRSLSQEVEPR